MRLLQWAALRRDREQLHYCSITILPLTGFGKHALTCRLKWTNKWIALQAYRNMCSCRNTNQSGCCPRSPRSPSGSMLRLAPDSVSLTSLDCQLNSCSSFSVGVHQLNSCSSFSVGLNGVCSIYLRDNRPINVIRKPTDIFRIFMLNKMFLVIADNLKGLSHKCFWVVFYHVWIDIDLYKNL